VFVCACVCVRVCAPAHASSPSPVSPAQLSLYSMCVCVCLWNVMQYIYISPYRVVETHKMPLLLVTLRKIANDFGVILFAGNDLNDLALSSLNSCTHKYHLAHAYFSLQGGEDSSDALTFGWLSVNSPLTVGLFCTGNDLTFVSLSIK